MERRKDGGADRSYFIGHFQLPPGVKQNPDNIPNNFSKQPVCIKCKRSFKTANSILKTTKKHSQTSITEPTPQKTYGMLIVTCNRKIITVVHWRKSFFSLRSGSVGKLFIEEMPILVDCWTYKTEQESVAMKTLMLLPTLLLQKNLFLLKNKRKRRNLKEKIITLEKQINKYLLCEGKNIQERLNHDLKCQVQTSDHLLVKN